MADSPPKEQNTPLVPLGQHQFPDPVQAKDGSEGEWMGPVAGQMVPLNCPPGLEYLAMIDQLMLKQKVEMVEAVAGAFGIGLATANQYKVKNSVGQNVYKAVEDTNRCTRFCCGPKRPFDMIIKDNADQEVIHLNRPLRCQYCCFPCCLQEIEVSSPPGTVIGYVKQKWSFIKPKFAVCDADGNEVLIIQGPWCTITLCGDVEFKIMTPDEEKEVGRISQEWPGLVKEVFTDADNFGISFPMDLDVRCKATLLGAAFLIDYMFFEKSKNNATGGLGLLT